MLVIEEFFDITLLHSGEFVIKNDILNLVFFAVLLDFFEFTCPDIGGFLQSVKPLDEFVASVCEEIRTKTFRKEEKKEEK